jgi:hypothetical protein
MFQVLTYLRGQQNITLSFDGMTKGEQPIYTVYAITAKHFVFPIKGDVYYGSHNAKYVLNLISFVCRRIILISLTLLILFQVITLIEA